MADTQPTLLVTGASGHMGKHVLQLLLDAGHTNIIATTRTPESLADFAAKGVTVRHADFDDPASLAQAFAGADRLLLISTDKVGAPGERIRQHLAAVKAAQEANVKHIVYTSLTAPDPTSPISLAPDHHATEVALAEGKTGFTILRNNIYSDGLVSTLAQAVKNGALVNAAANGKAAYVSHADCSRAAAAALAASFEGRRTIDISGPQAVSQSDLAGLAAQITGKSVAYTALPGETLRETLTGFGLPPFVIDLIVSFDAAVAEGRMSLVSNGVEELTGQKPTSVADILKKHSSELQAQ